jgi:hypothetical protein
LKPGGWLALRVRAAPSRSVGLAALYAAIQTHGAADVGLQCPVVDALGYTARRQERAGGFTTHRPPKAQG